MIRCNVEWMVKALAAAIVSAGVCSAQSLLYTDVLGARVMDVAWPTGAPSVVGIPTLPSGISLPVMVKRGPDGMLYLTDQGSANTVRRYLPDGGWDTSFVLPAGGNLAGPFGLAFHPLTGHLFVGDSSGAKVVEYDLDAGTVVKQYTTGMVYPTGMDFDATGRLYVCDWGANSVLRLGNGGTALTTFVAAGAGGLSQPVDVLRSGGQIYVSSLGTGQVLRYATSNGGYLGIEAPTGSEVLLSVAGLAQDSNGDIYVASNGTASIEKYRPSGNGYVGTFSAATSPLGLCFYEAREAPFPVKAHEVVATCLPDVIGGQPAADGACVKLIDGRSGGPTGRNWPAPMFSNDRPNPLDRHAWTYQNLGPVFAIAIDAAKAPNIFVAASSCYGPFAFGPSGGGGVYKLSGCDASIMQWIVTGAPAVNDNKLPNAHDVGLGDICYDRTHDQFFVSNMEDGRIYRFRDGGTKAKPIDSWDPFGANLDGDGLPSLGDRIWGLHVIGDANYHTTMDGRFLIFSVWLRDSAHKATPWPAWLVPLVGTNLPNNALFAVGLDATGKIVPGSLKLLRVMPYLDNGNSLLHWSNPVSDITTTTRLIFTAEKTMTGTGIVGQLGQSHYARTLRFDGVTLLKDVYKVGDVTVLGLQGCNSAGGVAVDWPWGRVWSTGDAILYPGYTVPFTSERAYGLQRFRHVGNLSSTPSWSTKTKIIDLDKDVSANDKSQPGDVEVFPFNARMNDCPSSSGGGGDGFGGS